MWITHSCENPTTWIWTPEDDHPHAMIEKLPKRPHNHKGQTPMQMSFLLDSMMTDADHVSQKVTFTAELSTSCSQAPEGALLQSFARGIAEARPIAGWKFVCCQRAQEIASLAILSNANTYRSTLCMSVGFTAAVLLQPYPQSGHKDYPKQMCLSRVLRASTIFVICYQILKQLLWRLLDLRSVQTKS
jgi:hypothetical protein